MAEYRNRAYSKTSHHAHPQRDPNATRRARVCRLAADTLEAAGSGRVIAPLDIPRLLARPVDVQDAQDAAAELADLRAGRLHRYGTTTPPHTNLHKDAYILRCKAIYVLMDNGCWA
jgi:hypothetical protein